MGVLNSEQVKARAAHLGITLEVPKDRDVIVAQPKTAVTPELAQGIRENRDYLIRDILMSHALRYLNDHHAKGADLSVLDEPAKKVEAYFPTDKPLETYREAIREYVETGLREFRRVRRTQRRAS